MSNQALQRNSDFTLGSAERGFSIMRGPSPLGEAYRHWNFKRRMEDLIREYLVLPHLKEQGYEVDALPRLRLGDEDDAAQ